MTFREIRNRFDNVVGGDNQFTAHCPAHHDLHSSLSVKQSDDGSKILLNCHAGCTAEKIVSALDLTISDLFTDAKGKPQRDVVATFNYTDAAGKLLYQKVKYTDKSFLQRRPDGAGGWIYNRKGISPLLYNLSAVIDSDVVYIAEGEKDSDTLIKMGFVATTGENGAGAGKWKYQYSESLKDKTVYILCDNDDIGRAYGLETAESVCKTANIVKLLDLIRVYPLLPEHGDISDIYDAMGADKTRELLETLVSETANYQPCEKPNSSTDQKKSYRPHDFSDTGNAEIFEREYRGYITYTSGGGWFCWDGSRHEKNSHRAVTRARELSGFMLDEALEAYSAAQRRAALEDAGAKESKALSDAKSYLNHAINNRKKPRIDAMLGLAEAGLWTELKAFDADPFDLNTPAGIVNLTSGKMRPHTPTAMCSMITRAAPGSTGRQQWNELLKTITDGDDKLMGYLQNVVGMSLIGKVYHEGIFIAYGGGRNGKSTFFNAIADALGDYAGHIAVNTLTTERTNKGAAFATLRGKRLVLTGELEEHQRFSLATIKALASTDVLVCEEKFRAPEEITQSHTLCLFTNHLSRVGSTDDGTWRRLTVIPFNAVIGEKTAIQNYGEVLAKEAGPAILQWAIEGACDFISNGCKLCVPDIVAMATEDYQAREDWLSNFIAECCVSGDRVSGSDLYAAYREWAQRSGEYVRRSNDFSVALETKGYHKMSSNGRRYWTGIKLDTPQPFGAQGFAGWSRA